MTEFLQTISLILSTFISEDLSCIAAGLLIYSGKLDFSTGIFACTAGIFLGDLGLFFLGRLLRRGFFSSRFFRKSLSNQIEDFSRSFEKKGWKLILAARFIPGMRFPTYTGAGFLSARLGKTAGIVFVACCIWTPLLVILSFWMGETLSRYSNDFLQKGLYSIGLTALFLFFLFRFFLLISSKRGRIKTLTFFQKLCSFEFWPTKIIYIIYILYYSLYFRRHFKYILTANPGIKNGGSIGESKVEVLEKIAKSFVLDWIALPSGNQLGEESKQALKKRIHLLQKKMKERKWSFPIILKPDEGKEGDGVKQVTTWKDVKSWFETYPENALAQVFHPGPYEAGIYYYRFPDQKKGDIFSITDKKSSSVTGDGVSTCKELIWSHKYLRKRASLLTKLNPKLMNYLPSSDEVVYLGEIGNHAKGAEFRNGKELLTKALRAKIDQISCNIDGFYVGRFDIRYRSKKELQAGKGFKIIELNGVSSYPTEIFEPRLSFYKAQQIIRRQMKILFRIADYHYKNGVSCPTVLSMLRTWCFYSGGR